jgi:AraC-like DNA-binding protein
MQKKVISFQILKSKREFVRFQIDEGNHFYDKLHQHPQWQLTLIQEGVGQLMVGDYLGRFEPGEMYLITSNMPHVLRSDAEYYPDNSPLKSRAITLFFDFDALGDHFWESEELKELNHWIKSTKGSFILSGKEKEALIHDLNLISETQGTDKFLMGLKVLEKIRISSTIQFLNKTISHKILSENEGKRMGKVMAYILTKSQTEVKLSEAANIANMSKEAFCRFFKERTGKSFTVFVAEVKIQQSTKLLMESDLSISQIAYQSGFQNLSYFNRVFKNIHHKTPKEFRKSIHKN